MTRNVFFTIITTIFISGCATVSPLSGFSTSATLEPCPWTPNCVSTEAEKEKKRVEPFVLTESIEAVWPQIIATIQSLDNSSIEQERPGYVYAKFHSRVFKFVDYFEVLHIPEGNRLAVRSSSKLGISDLGVNRQRVESFRSGLVEKGIIR